MGAYAFYGILVLCICFIQTFGYERCTYGTYVYFCNTGSCCKISYTWYCTGKGLNTSDCDSLSQTTTIEPTTNRSDVSIYATVASIGVLVVVALMAVGAIIGKRKQTNTRPSPVVRSLLVDGVYKMQSKGKKKKKT